MNKSNASSEVVNLVASTYEATNTMVLKQLLASVKAQVTPSQKTILSTLAKGESAALSIMMTNNLMRARLSQGSGPDPCLLGQLKGPRSNVTTTIYI